MQILQMPVSFLISTLFITNLHLIIWLNFLENLILGFGRSGVHACGRYIMIYNMLYSSTVYELFRNLIG